MKIPHHSNQQQYLSVLNMMGSHRIADDDDISQHEYSILVATNNDVDDDENNDDASSSSATNRTGGRGGYRRIEEWHEEHVNENPEEHYAITHLKRERARWARAFESLDGGGI